MIEWRFLKGNEREDVERSLKIQFGINEVSGEIIMAGRERLYLFSGDANENDLKEIEGIAPVDRIGVYFAKFIGGEVKLSIEGTQIFKDQIAKNIFELDKEQTEKWMKGEELNLRPGKKGFLVMKYRDNFLGCGKASEEKIGNFVPKNRRLKNRLD